MLKINRTAKKLLLLFIFLVMAQVPPVFFGLKLASSLVAAENVLRIFDLGDKHVTTKARLTLRGEAPGADEIIVNNEIVDIAEDGAFRVGLVARPGKNLVKISARGGGFDENRKIRFLRLLNFSDLDRLYGGKPYWAKKDVMSLATVGIVEGYPDGNFEPRKAVSRGEFATWLIRAKGHDVSTPGTDPFFDVPKEHWRAPYIKEAALRKYMFGYSKDNFGIDEPLKRGEAAVVVDRAEDLKNSVNAESVFDDVYRRNPAAAAIYRLYKAKLIIGVSKWRSLFQPAREITRAEAATLISRLPNVKRFVTDLFNFASGYDDSRMCRVNTEPIVQWTMAEPSSVPNDGETPVVLSIKVDDKQGLKDISQVRLDMREVGGPPDAIMYDDGTHGDESSDDGIYSIGIKVYEDVEAGSKRMRVVVMDRSGWESESWFDLFIVKPW